MIYVLINSTTKKINGKPGKDEDDLTLIEGHEIISTKQNGLLIHPDLNDVIYNDTTSLFELDIDLNSPEELKNRIEERELKIIETTSTVIGLIMATEGDTEKAAKGKGIRFFKVVKEEVYMYERTNYRIKDASNGDVDDGLIDLIDSIGNPHALWLDNDISVIIPGETTIREYMKTNLDY